MIRFGCLSGQRRLDLGEMIDEVVRHSSQSLVRGIEARRPAIDWHFDGFQIPTVPGLSKLKDMAHRFRDCISGIPLVHLWPLVTHPTLLAKGR